MIPRPRGATRTATLGPFTTVFQAGEEGGAQAVPLAQCGDSARPAFQARALKRERDLVEQVAEEQALVIGDRQDAIRARKTSGGENGMVRRDRVELPVEIGRAHI